MKRKDSSKLFESEEESRNSKIQKPNTESFSFQNIDNSDSDAVVLTLDSNIASTYLKQHLFCGRDDRNKEKVRKFAYRILKLGFEQEEEAIQLIQESGIDSKKERFQLCDLCISLFSNSEMCWLASLFNLWNYRPFVLLAVQRSVDALGYATDFQKDGEIVKFAVEHCGYALQFASEELTKDREIVLAAVKSKGCSLEFASEELKSDREIVMEAVKQNGWALENASEESRNDRKIVMLAVEQYGKVLEFASDELKNDREIVMTAVKRLPSSNVCF